MACFFPQCHISQDVDTIYLSQDTRELNLQDFIHLENRLGGRLAPLPSPLRLHLVPPLNSLISLCLLLLFLRDLIAIIAALEHNQWFTKLSIKDHKLVILAGCRTCHFLVGNTLLH